MSKTNKVKENLKKEKIVVEEKVVVELMKKNSEKKQKIIDNLKEIERLGRENVEIEKEVSKIGKEVSEKVEKVLTQKGYKLNSDNLEKDLEEIKRVDETKLVGNKVEVSIFKLKELVVETFAQIIKQK